MLLALHVCRDMGQRYYRCRAPKTIQNRSQLRPSYQSLELAQLFWRRSDIWSKLEEAKTVVLEPRNSYELAEASQRYTAGWGLTSTHWQWGREVSLVIDI